MQTFLKSPIHSSSRKGFTLVELLISVAIISIVTATVLVRHNSFDSTVLLKSAAYEIALSLRETQIKSLSQVRSGNSQTSFNFPYGISFSTSNEKEYKAFSYGTSTKLRTPRFVDLTYGAYPIELQTFQIGRTMKISDICILQSATETCKGGGVSRLDISFRRPEFKSLFFAADGANAPLVDPATITGAKIKVSSESGANTFVVEITSLGQISVSKQP